MTSKKPVQQAQRAVPDRKKKNFFLKPVPLFFLMPFLLGLGVLLIVKSPVADQPESPGVKITAQAVQTGKIFTAPSTGYTKPLLLWENDVESPELFPVKREINIVISDLVNQQVISEGSVYVNRLNTNQWFYINPQSTFTPASFYKLPIMMVYLKQSERNSSSLNRKILFDKIPNQPNQLVYQSRRIKVGKSYTIRELLDYMIVSSDNNATYLLNKHLDVSELDGLFNSLGMDSPEIDNLTYQMNVYDFSKFLQVLYNSTYLNSDNSNFALSMLTQSDFKIGMVSGVPEGIQVAHKFGESGQVAEGKLELHESGIIYLPDNPLLVTISVKGKKMESLPGAISSITKAVITSMNSPQVTEQRSGK